MSAVTTLFRLNWRDRLLYAEATVLLGGAALTVALVPFRRIAETASRPLQQLEPQTQTVRRVRWAVRAAARRVPWPAVCYQQGLAAHWMLRRRGIPSQMYYGAANSPE